MEDREFFDLLYQQFTKTTGAENKFYMPEEDTAHFVGGGAGTWIVWAVDKEHSKEFVASFDKEVDADFFAGVHGCIADLIRRLHTAIDEADRLDIERDEAQQDLAAVALENEELREELDHMKGLQRDDRMTAVKAITELDEARAVIADLEMQLNEVGR